VLNKPAHAKPKGRQQPQTAVTLCLLICLACSFVWLPLPPLSPLLLLLLLPDAHVAAAG
jgi:hypothetical protein